MYSKLQKVLNLQAIYKGNPMVIAADFFMETSKVRKACSYALQILKDYDSQPKLIYPAKLHTIIEEKRKIFHHVNSLKSLISNKPSIKKT